MKSINRLRNVYGKSSLCAAVAAFITIGAVNDSLAGGAVANDSGWIYSESGAKRTFAFTVVE